MQRYREKLHPNASKDQLSIRKCGAETFFSILRESSMKSHNDSNCAYRLRNILKEGREGEETGIPKISASRNKRSVRSKMLSNVSSQIYVRIFRSRPQIEKPFSERIPTEVRRKRVNTSGYRKNGNHVTEKKNL